MAAKRKGGKKAGKKKGAHKGTHKRGAGKKRGKKKGAKKTSHLHIPTISSMASKVGKALGAGLKRPAGNALKRAKGKPEVKKALHSLGKKLAPKKRGKKKGK